MDEGYISGHSNTIIINMLAKPKFEALRKNGYIDGHVVIEEVELPGSKIMHPLYSENRAIFQIEVDKRSFDGVDSNQAFGIKLICRNDEYVYAIQENYMKLLEDKAVDVVDLMPLFFPRVELLDLEAVGETHVSRLSTGKVKHLLNHTKAEEEKLAKHFEEKTLKSTTDELGIEKSVKNRFYLVVDKFKNSLTADGIEQTYFLEFKGNGFHGLKDGQVPNIPAPDPQRIAIIVHGLASSIGEAYHDLALHLEKAGHHVFGFDYLTVNQPISVSSEQLAENIKRLKKNFPESEVLIVAHSMGGLVARAAEVAHGAEVDQLIMAGTPNSGSLLVSNPNLVRSLFLLGSIFKIIPIKFEDYRQLIVSEDLLGLEDLSNKSGFISELNTKDLLHYSKKYFSLVGRYKGLSNDIIVHSENMTEINGTNMPSIPLEKHHFEYFRGAGWYEPLDQALLYLK